MQRRIDGPAARPTPEVARVVLDQSATPGSRSSLISQPVKSRSPRRWRRLTWTKPLVRRASLVIVIAISLTGGALLWNQSRVSAAWHNAQNGLDALQQGTANLLISPRRAERAFSSASRDFSTAVGSLKRMDNAGKSFFLLPAARDSLFILRAGMLTAEIGELLTKLLDSKPPAVKGDFVTVLGTEAQWLNEWSTTNQQNLRELLALLERLNETVKAVNPDVLPASLREQFASWKNELPRLLDRYRSIEVILREVPVLVGENSSARYAVLLQNNGELRPTGGFIGSYAIIELNGQKPAGFWFQTNVYKDPTPADSPIMPYPLDSTGKPHQYPLRDANWDPDFPTTAAFFSKLYEEAYQRPLHGVIALDTSVVTDLLKITGPIDFPQYQTRLDANNFLDTIQFKIEREYFTQEENKQDNEPKKILADFIPALFQKLQNLKPDDQRQILEVLSKAVSRKSIQIYSANPRVQTQLATLEIDGRVKTSESDYLYLNNANLDGGKSSLNVSQEVKLQQSVVGSTILNTLTITRTHRGDGQWPDADNKNFLRIYVPKGSKLLSTSGKFEKHRVSEEHDKTVIEGWFTTPVAHKHQAEIHYTLPSTVTSKHYSLLIQKQPGESPSQFSVSSDLLGEQKFELTEDKVLERR